MIQYYLDLISKPKYMLSEAESMFIEIFSFIAIAVIVFAIWIVLRIGFHVADRVKELQLRKLHDKEEDSNEQDL